MGILSGLLLTTIYFVLIISILVLVIYALILSIKALKIYIDKNS